MRYVAPRPSGGASLPQRGRRFIRRGAAARVGQTPARGRTVRYVAQRRPGGASAPDRGRQFLRGGAAVRVGQTPARGRILRYVARRHPGGASAPNRGWRPLRGGAAIRVGQGGTFAAASSGGRPRRGVATCSGRIAGRRSFAAGYLVPGPGPSTSSRFDRFIWSSVFRSYFQEPKMSAMFFFF